MSHSLKKVINYFGGKKKENLKVRGWWLRIALRCYLILYRVISGDWTKIPELVLIRGFFFNPASCEDFNQNFRRVNHFQTHKRSPEIFPIGAIFAPFWPRSCRHPVGHQIMRRFFPKFSNPIIFIFPPKILLTKSPYSHVSKSCDW